MSVGRLAWRTIAVAVSVTIVFVAVGWFSLASLRSLIAGAEWVDHTHEVLNRIENVRAAIADADLGLQHYLLSGSAADLRTFRTHADELRDDIRSLQALVMNPGQQSRLAALVPAVGEHLASLEREVAEPTGLGVDRNAAVMQIANDMRDAQMRLLRERKRADSDNARRAYQVLAVALVASLVFMVAAATLIATGMAREHRMKEELRARDELLRAMFNTMISGVVTTTERGVIHSMNPAFARLVGASEPELIGRNVLEFMVLPAGASREDLLAERDRSVGRITNREVRRADGRIVPVEVSLASFEVGGERLYAANWTDVSERLEIDRMKDEFISIVSHELRTPLTSIRGALQLVLSDPPEFKDEEHAPLLDIALTNCERLIRIINDILDVSKIEAGKLTLQIRPCEMAELARISVQNVSEIARRGNVQVVCEVDADAGAVLGDFDRLVQVFVNLLSNALKFAPAGSAVTFAAARHGDQVDVTVRDRGPGIAERDQARLFKKFNQLDGSATRRTGGTGLGLHIVKALVEQHHGTVSLASEVGAGSVFTVSLPGARSETRAIVRPINAACGRRTILVVDDDPDVRRVLGKQLELAGYRVLEAADGAAAIDTATAERPDLITMDLVMPGLGGISAIRMLATDARTSSIPVVIISAVADSVSLDHPFAVIPKPVDGQALQREVERLLGSPAAVTLLLAEDDDDLRNVLTSSLSRSGFRVLAAGDGATACEIYDTQPCDAVVVDLHMPLVDGFALIEHVRNGPDGTRVPIVVVSGSNTGDGERRSLQLGANVYFTKPVEPRALVAELNRLVA